MIIAVKRQSVFSADSARSASNSRPASLRSAFPKPFDNQGLFRYLENDRDLRNAMEA